MELVKRIMKIIFFQVVTKRTKQCESVSVNSKKYGFTGQQNQKFLKQSKQKAVKNAFQVKKKQL